MRLLLILLFSFTALFGFDKPTPVLKMESFMSKEFLSSIKQAYYQALFNFSEDIDVSIYSTDEASWKLKFGRVLLQTVGQSTFIAADHFSNS
jgi:hypothetical protein